MGKTKKVNLKSLRIPAFVICDAVSRDPSTLKHTIYGIFDRVHAELLPSKMPFAIYTKIVGLVGKHEVGIELVDPSGKVANDGPPTIEVDAEKGHPIQLVTHVGVFEFKKFGTYIAKLLIDGKRHPHICALEVIKAEKK
jgi:hypothetical protein